jgi:ATP-dependent Clp protease ATP-binding subunit ClpA
MRYLPWFCLLLGSLAWGQEKPLPSNVPPEYLPPITRDNDEQKTLPASASAVAPDEAVLTIEGLCAQAAAPTASASSPSCHTIITRAQFEMLINAILTNVKPSMERQVASAYPNLLAMAREAESRGLEKSPRFQERLAFARVQMLSQELVRQIDEESAKVPEKDIEDYYNNHAALFEQATLERIFIPNRKRMDPLPNEKVTPETLKAQRKEAEDAMTRVAEELRATAAAGGNFVQLQKEAYTAAGTTDVLPNPSLGQLRSASLPPAHAPAFDLKPGEVSQVLSDSTGHYIYKLDAKGTEPLERVKDEIHKRLQNQRKEEAIQAVQRPITTEFNQAYFGPLEKHNRP